MDLPKQKNVKKLLGIMSVVLMYRVLTCKLGNSRNISIICTFSVQGVRWPVMLIPPTLAIKGSNFSYNLKVCPRRFLYVHMYVHTVVRLLTSDMKIHNPCICIHKDCVCNEFGWNCT